MLHKYIFELNLCDYQHSAVRSGLYPISLFIFIFIYGPLLSLEALSI